jgi:hypothetical protein
MPDFILLYHKDGNTKFLGQYETMNKESLRQILNHLWQNFKRSQPDKYSEAVKIVSEITACKLEDYRLDSIIPDMIIDSIVLKKNDDDISKVLQYLDYTIYRIENDDYESLENILLNVHKYISTVYTLFEFLRSWSTVISEEEQVAAVAAAASAAAGALGVAALRRTWCRRITAREG